MASGTKRHSGAASSFADIVPSTGDTVAAGPLVIGYARVSTEDQRLDLQRDALAHAGCHRTFEDRASGARADRPGLAAALSHLRRGDTLVVWRLDRLGRTTHQLVGLLERFERDGICRRSQSSALVLAKSAEFCSDWLPTGGVRAHIICLCARHHRVGLANGGLCSQSVPMIRTASEWRFRPLENQRF